MKKKMFLAAAALCAALASCNVAPLEEEGSSTLSGTINLSIAPEGNLPTKAVNAYTTALDYEETVGKVQVFVFDSDGSVNYYNNLGTSMSESINTTQGEKSVWAIINGPNLGSITTLSALKEVTVDLSANSKNMGTGFVMVGSNTCTVGTSATTCNITVRRLAARVALVSVKNQLPSGYGSLTINRVFLNNVVGIQNLEGTAAASAWYNKEGRADETTRVSDHIIDGSSYQASCPTLTFKAVGQNVASNGTYTPTSPDVFYCYANDATAAPNGFTNPFAAQRTVLVVDASIGNRNYYYPVVLDDAVIVRNTTYTVAVTVTGLGSDDPNKPVQKGSLNFNISAAGWESGAVYEETI